MDGAVDPWRAVVVALESRFSYGDLWKLVEKGAKHFVYLVNCACGTQLKSQQVWSSDIVRLAKVMPQMLDGLTPEEIKALKESMY